MPERNSTCRHTSKEHQGLPPPAENLPGNQAQHLAGLFKTLGDPTRIRILYLLTQREHCVCELAENSNVSLSAISHQLRLLKANRLIKSRREGRNMYYSLDDEHVDALFRQGLAHVKHAE